MIKTRLKKISMLTLAGVMSIGMMFGTFNVAKVNAAEPSASQAQITVGKTMTGTHFRDIENFNFELEAVSGYTNPNASTSTDGQTIPASQVPMPAGAANNKITKSVGNFRTAVSGDTATVRTRTGAFDNISYSTAGYYLYTLKEVKPANPVPDVDYDESTYYVVVYVVNNTDSNNNTISGVHVESITAWHNEKNSNANFPNLKDIAKKGYTHNHIDGETENDDNTGDNNGQTAKPNSTYDGSHGQTRWDDLGKVGVSVSPNPNDPNNTNGDNRNKLDAYKFWNKQTPHNIELTKNVKGNLGDTTKEFEFEVTMAGLDNSAIYSVTKTGTPTLVNLTEAEGKKGSVDNTSNKITASSTGEAKFKVKLKDGDGVNFIDIPNNATYNVKEIKSNHAPSYQVTSTETETAIISSASGNTNGEKETALATATETVNPSDGNITIAYTNTRDLETITGIPNMVFYFGIAGIVALIAFVAVRKRRDDSLVEM